jgi:hypothetical protein
MTWTALASLNFFINSIIWNGNVVNWAPVWCDICQYNPPRVPASLPFLCLIDLTRHLHQLLKLLLEILLYSLLHHSVSTVAFTISPVLTVVALRQEVK